MASPMDTKELKELNETEVEVFLNKIKFQNIREKLLSGDFGEVTGELLCDLDDETLLNDLEITKGMARKQFMKAMTKYKNEGVPINLLIPEPIESLEEMTQNVTKTVPVITESPATTKVTQSQKGMAERTKLNSLFKMSTKITKDSTSEMDIYSFPAKRILVSALKEPLYGQNLRKIIIMGETGTGESTLLNAFVNYAAGVEMEDRFRFKLVLDETERATDQSKSQTSEISGYLIENTELDFAVQIWDTPGFGDTEGVERDEEIKKQINELLKKEDFCHAICFVVKASANRLTDTQKYIIDRVLLFFGKEAKDNIYLLATFADDSRPDVLDALEKSNLPFDENRWFAFNNASLFKPSSKRTAISRTYWEIVNKSIRDLFKTVGEVRPFSLTSTKEVIEEREDLFQNISAISDQIERTVFKLTEFEETLEKLNSQKDEVIRTGEFKHNVPTQKTTLVPTHNVNTLCKKCFTNCHLSCITWGVYLCDKFYWNGACKICNCGSSSHHRQNYKYEVTMEINEVIDTALKDEHDAAKDSLVRFEELKGKFEREKSHEHGLLRTLVKMQYLITHWT